MPSRDPRPHCSAVFVVLAASWLVLSAVPAHASPVEPSVASRTAWQLLQRLSGWLGGLWEREETADVSPPPAETPTGPPPANRDEGGSIDPDG